MNPVQYLIINKGAGMSTGKVAAQAAHASVEGVRISAKEPGGNPWHNNVVNQWYKGGHYAKIVLEVPDAEALRTAQTYIEDRGFKTKLIIDEGRTEIDPMTPTALGVEVVDKNRGQVQATFSSFKLYSDPSKPSYEDIIRDAGPFLPSPEALVPLSGRTGIQDEVSTGTSKGLRDHKGWVRQLFRGSPA